MRLKYTDTPVTKIVNDVTERFGVTLLVKREDLNHPQISGNKWWKLKYNLQQAQKEGHQTLLTFGGAFSNHIYATAAAANELGLKSIGIIRGEETLPLNSTLTFAKSKNMDLHYVSRSDYRLKEEGEFLNRLRERFNDFYLIPEGGTNSLALRGTYEFGQNLLSIPCDSIYLPVGTAGTISGIIGATRGHRQVVGIPVFKNGGFLNDSITEMLQRNFDADDHRWCLLLNYHHGGYGKTTPELLTFIKSMFIQNVLPLDQVYTGKMMWAIFEEIKSGRIERGSTILAIHTGGLQGASPDLF